MTTAARRKAPPVPRPSCVVQGERVFSGGRRRYFQLLFRVIAGPLRPRTPRVLAIGAHPDDPELGAGGFIRRLAEECDAVVNFLVLTRGVKRAARGATYAPASRTREVFVAAEVLGVQRERVTTMSIVGDAFAKPILSSSKRSLPRVDFRALRRLQRCLLSPVSSMTTPNLHLWISLWVGI